MVRSRAGILGVTVLVALLLPIAWAAAQHDHGTGGTTAVACPEASPSAHGGHDQQADADTCSPYAGDFSAAASIRALTPEEIAEIENGEGAGFAKPAELNGVPGPRHVLDLTAEQQTQIQAIDDEMKAAVVPAGQRYLAAQQALEEDFRAGTLTEADLPGRVGDVHRLRGDVATIHLSAHLATAQILTPDQIATYNRLRGYD
ncbi:MAG: Spy/CpxP family protein refolding chaperone [Thermomicrobiales bacterium]